MLATYFKEKKYYKFKLWVNAVCEIGKKCSTVKDDVVQGLMRKNIYITC